MRESLLRARDKRQALIESAGEPGVTVVFASTSIPGPGKNPEGLSRLFDAACEHLASRLGASPASRGLDALGPWAIFRTTLPAEVVKRIAVDRESARPSGRLLDLDVYDDGRQVDRASLGLPPRTCLVCDEPAVECIRLGEARGGGTRQRRARPVDGPPSRRFGTDRILAPLRRDTRPAGRRERLAACLVTGARVELALTPKPGLVDRHDNGSHPDLSFELMTRSIDLLPQYFDELIAGFAGRDPLPADGLGDRDPLTAAALAACVEVGRRAERRMLAEVGSNAHRGYIYLAGLSLLGAIDGELRDGIRRVARASAPLRQSGAGVAESHGAAVRARHALGGIEREALDGLPSVFDHALPALRERRRRIADARTSAVRSWDAGTDEPLALRHGPAHADGRGHDRRPPLRAARARRASAPTAANCRS